jgi:dolichol-phosphate mannosyltransferase
MAQLLSIISPAFNEEKNIPCLYEQLVTLLEKNAVDFEWLIIDDCSRDNTFAVAEAIAKKDMRVRVFNFSRNFGSHAAIRCGLANCRGEMAIVIAADMQDPPDTIPDLLSACNDGYDVVWAVRVQREGETRSTKFFSRMFYWIMKNIVGLQNQPQEGADFFCVTRKVIDTLNQFKERNINILALLCWLGFSQKKIEYVKQARLYGNSGWTLQKKLKLAVDSVVSFSFSPIRMFSFIGFAAALAGFIYALIIIIRSLFGIASVEGWASLMVITLFLGGIILITLGTLGEYIWRNLDEARMRPMYVIDRTVNQDSANISEEKMMSNISQNKEN